MSNAVPRLQTQVFYNYDKAIVSYLHDNVKGYDYSRGTRVPILCVFASPQRAFAQAARQIARRRGASQKSDEDIRNVPLPIMSLSRVDEKFDPTRYVKWSWGRAQYQPDEDKWFGARFPQPYNFTYQLDVWTRTIEELDDISNQLRLLLRADEMWLSVDHPDPYKTQRVLVLHTGQAENSEVDPRNADERLLRRSFTYVVHGWLCYPRDVTYIIEQIIVDFYGDDAMTEFLDRVVVTGGTPEGSYEDPGSGLIPGEDGTVVYSHRQYMSTSLFCGQVVGEAVVGVEYGSLRVPSRMQIVGMQVTVGGRTPAGGYLEFQLVRNGIVIPDYYIRVNEGLSKAVSVFAAPLPVIENDVLSAKCTSVGSEVPGDWAGIQFNATIEMGY